MFEDLEYCEPNGSNLPSCYLTLDGISIGFGFGVINESHQAVLVSIVSTDDHQFFSTEVSGYCYGRNYRTFNAIDRSIPA